LLAYAFDKNIQWLLPPGQPPFKPNVGKSFNNNLAHELKKLSIFCSNGEYKNLKENRRQQLFIELLENIDKEDAIMLCYIKDKQLQKAPGMGNITKNLISEAFPLLATKWKKNG
jgi:hypothetical protein